MTGSALVQTGIYGPDQIFLGRDSQGNLVLVEGAAGTGKTLLGVEFVYPAATNNPATPSRSTAQKLRACAVWTGSLYDIRWNWRQHGRRAGPKPRRTCPT